MCRQAQLKFDQCLDSTKTSAERVQTLPTEQAMMLRSYVQSQLQAYEKVLLCAYIMC